MNYVVVTFYKFFPVLDPKHLKKTLEEKLQGLNLVGSLLIATEGLNGYLAGEKCDTDLIIKVLKKITGFSDLNLKVSKTDTLPFLRMKVKLKKEIVTIGLEGVKPSELVGDYIDAHNWNNILKSDDYVVIDTRNDYEVDIGTFKNSVNPKIKSFREFPLWWQENKAKYKEKKVAMFCTGGIRCEKSTNYILQDGCNEVVHLKGGILEYLGKVPKSMSMWEGACFVFDQRVSVLHNLTEGPHLLCFACRRPINLADVENEYYQEGVSCKYCFDENDSARRERFKERQKQISLAKKRGYKHIGR